MAIAPTSDYTNKFQMPVAQQDMRFCGAQRNKKCLKSFKAFVPFGLKRKRKKKRKYRISNAEYQITK
jgi:hypothetical protein